MRISSEGEFRLDGPVAAERLGAAVARELRAGDAICLWGALGAGKTTLARGLIRALAGETDEVPSPTFTLVQIYAGPAFEIAHFDLYRLESAAEIRELGLDAALDAGAAVIEWPERLGGHLPEDRLDIELLHDANEPETVRIARLTPHGAWEGRPLDL